MGKTQPDPLGNPLGFCRLTFPYSVRTFSFG